MEATTEAESMKKTQRKKKIFKTLMPVRDFMREQPGEIKQELNGIIWRLEVNGTLVMPYGEKISGENLFAIRVVQAGNIRVFYVYGVNDLIFGIHAYEKKTEQIPDCERKRADRMIKLLQQSGALK